MGQMLGGQQQAQDNPDNPEVAWWCKLLSKIIGTLAGIGEDFSVFVNWMESPHDNESQHPMS